MRSRRGSALLMALWIILVLGVIVISFAFEARLQGGINIYVQNRNRVRRLVDAGRIIGEVVLLGFQDAKEPEISGGEADWSEIFEDEDRWCVEKYELKTSSRCTIGPIQLDEEDPDSGTITVEISMSQADQGGGININELYSADSSYIVRWQMILEMCGLSREDDFTDEEGKRVNLQYEVIAGWNDYRDDDDSRTAIEGNECGAEKKDYEEYYDDHEKEIAEEDRFEPANGEIADLKELSRVLVFQKYPAILTGGVLNPWEDKKNQISVSRGLMNMGLFTTTGSAKINVNDCTVDQLLTVPGIYDEDEVDEDDKAESREVAEAIVACRKIMPTEYDVDETRSEWPYKDWQDLCSRVEDEFDVEIGEDAQQYLEYKPEGKSIFKMKITTSLMDMSYTAECECYIKDKKVRYVSWKE